MKHLCCLILCATVAGCSREASTGSPASTSPAPAAAASSFTPIATGWTAEERARFYHLSEGSAIFPLAWFESIETASTDAAGKTTLGPVAGRFANWGVIEDAETPANPYGLPVGFTVMKLGKIRWMGVNCAACHVGEITHNGARLRIDGGPNMTVPLFDVMAALQLALEETIKSPSRMSRFVDRASAWSKSHPDPDDLANRPTLEDLRLLGSGLKTASGFKALAATVGTEAGPGRIDAFGFARNLLFNEPANRRRIDAPVSTPDVWDMEHTAWLHWGANTNSVIERNLGQALATGVTYDPKTYDSTMDLAAAYTLETLGYKLRAPQWPEQVLGTIDHARAERGRAIFDASCASCHASPLRTTATGLKVYRLFSPKEIGTDPAAAINFDAPVTVNGIATPFPYAALKVLQTIKQSYYTRNNISEATQALWESRSLRPPDEWSPKLRATLANSADYDDTRVGKVYPAKPLGSAWATAPYLHNGSVPTIYHLLLPGAQRPKTFFVGQREFDPVHVGYLESAGPASPAVFKFDVSQPGNSNAGHEYGTTLNDAQRFDLIEYLKAMQTTGTNK